MRCSISDCPDDAVGRGWCKKHYSRWARHGDPLGGRDYGSRSMSDADRFWRKVDRSGGPDACWPWLGYRDAAGYGWHGIKRNGVRNGNTAQRFAYEFGVGPIPDGMSIDHLCNNPTCQNPRHLEPVPISINVGRRHFYDSLSKTACAKGHPANESNTGIRANGTPYCRVCQREYARARRIAQGATAIPDGRPKAPGRERINRPRPPLVFPT